MDNLKPPLAFRMRPNLIDGIIGQTHLVGEKGFLSNCVKTKTLISIIFFGPPGSGKTTLAEAFAHQFSAHIIKINAVITTKKEIETAIQESVLFSPAIIIVDEVHRLNKDKQDLLLAGLEEGNFYLIGATTANPYMSINKALRSRTHLLEVKPLTEDEIILGLNKAASDPSGLDGKCEFTEKALSLIAKRSGGDLRFAYNCLEVLALSRSDGIIDETSVNATFNEGNILIDKDEGGHYDAVSALQKSIRGSDVDAALYYLARLCLGGDLESIARRLLVTAYEDVGLGNPAAVTRAASAIEHAKLVGFPEAVIPLGFAVCDLALSPKSRAGADSIEKAMKEAGGEPLEVLDYLKLTPVNVAEKDKYPYDRPDLWEKMQYLPSKISDARFFALNESATGSYEKQLNENYRLLKKTLRRADLSVLKKE